MAVTTAAYLVCGKVDWSVVRLVDTLVAMKAIYWANERVDWSVVHLFSDQIALMAVYWVDRTIG